MDFEVAKGKLKKEVKQLKKGILSGCASYSNLLKHYPADAVSDISLTANRPVLEHWRPDHLRAVVLWLYSLVPSPHYVQVRNKGLIVNCVFLVLRGATHADWEFSKEAAPFLATWQCVKTKQPRGLWSPQRKEVLPIESEVFFEKESAPQPREVPPDSEVSRLGHLSPPHLLSTAFELCLNLDELRSHGFVVPLQNVQAADGYVMTRTAQRDATVLAKGAAVVGRSEEVGPLRVLAIDCEMCQTAGGGLQLARVTVVDSEDAVLLDEIVKPEAPILDYLTPYSGMTPDLVATARLTFSEVRQRVIDLIDGVEEQTSASQSTPPTRAGEKRRRDASTAADLSASSAAADTCIATDSASASSVLRPALLVGHSLEADLNALRIVHTRVIDTTVLYPHPSALPYRQSLRNLARMHLGRAIQTGHGSSGHDSAEDAIATLHLLLLHLQKSVPRAGGGEVAPPVVDFTRFLAARGRDGMLMPPPVQRLIKEGQDRRQSTVGPTSGGMGLASTLTLLQGESSAEGSPSFPGGVTTAAALHSDAACDATSGPPEVTSPIVVLGPGCSTSHRRRIAKNVLAAPEFRDSAVCSGLTLIGSDAFTTPLASGTAADIVRMPCSALLGDGRRALGRAADAVRKCHRGRVEGRWTGVGLTIVEICLPQPVGGASKDAESSAPWELLNSLMTEWTGTLPPGTAVIMSTTQGVQKRTCSHGRAEGEEADPALDARLWGSTFLHVVNAPQAQAPATVNDSRSPVPPVPPAPADDSLSPVSTEPPSPPHQ
jgi:DNA polymerase III epsilon subunit-like protein